MKKKWDYIEVHKRYTAIYCQLNSKMINFNNLFILSVAVIIFNITRKVFVLVRQFRPGEYYARYLYMFSNLYWHKLTKSYVSAVYIQSIPLEDKQGLIDCQKYPAKLGLTLEFCAGIIDKDKSLEDIAQEEIMEETGYEVPVSKLEKVRVFR